MLRGCPTSEYDHKRTNADQKLSTDELSRKRAELKNAAVDEMKRCFAV
jgi:hypothetical protein